MRASAPTATAPRISPARCPTPRGSPPPRSRTAATPISLYRTITDGFGQMAPQSWMVPRQKYDVIHYIRETFLKPHNPAQYVAINRAYLDRLPKGTTRGPSPSAIEPWVAMDYGSCLLATIEAGSDLSNVAYKGIAVRLDPGQGGSPAGRAWVVYDHDTLRLAAAWTGQGFIDWKGINFNGQHQVHPEGRRPGARRQPRRPRLGQSRTTRAPGTVASSAATAAATARCRPTGRATGASTATATAWSSPIPSARPTSSRCPGLETDPAQPGVPIFTRTLEIGPSAVELSMRVASPRVSVALAGDHAGASLTRRDGSIMLSIAAGRIVAGPQGADVRRRAQGAGGVRRRLARAGAAQLVHPRRPEAMARGPQDAADHRPR